MTIPKNPPERDAEYLRIIAKEPCCLCYPWAHKVKRIGDPLPAAGQAHHYGRRGKGTAQKCSDYETVPICIFCHSKIESPGQSSKRVQEKAGVEFEKVGGFYRQKHERKFNEPDMQ